MPLRKNTSVKFFLKTEDLTDTEIQTLIQTTAQAMKLFKGVKECNILGIVKEK